MNTTCRRTVTGGLRLTRDRRLMSFFCLDNVEPYLISYKLKPDKGRYRTETSGKGYKAWKMNNLLLRRCIAYAARKAVTLTAFLTVIFGCFPVCAAEDAAHPVQVRLPDGLYLYQPRIKDEVFSPLFIVKEGSLIDPYALAKEIGIERFTAEYVKDKVFSVYMGGELVGRLSSVRLEFAGRCELKDFLLDIEGRGRYEGKGLQGKYADKSIYVYNESERKYGSVKAIAAPGHLEQLKDTEGFVAVKEDRDKTTEAVRKRYDRELVERIKERLKSLYEEEQVIKFEHGVVDSVKALDIDGNGKKDLMGIYSFTVGFMDASKDPRTETPAGINIEVVFTFFDSGVVEIISLENGTSPAFNIGGIIDVDRDGIFEVGVEANIDAYEEDYIEDGRQITVFRKDAGGWKGVFNTGKVCGAIYY